MIISQKQKLQYSYKVTNVNHGETATKNLSVQTPIILLRAAGSSVPRLLPPPTVLTELANKHYSLWPRLLCKQTFQLMSKTLKQCNLLLKHCKSCQHFIIVRKLDYLAQNTYI